MSMLVLLFGILIVVLTSIGFMSPSRLLTTVSNAKFTGRLYVFGALRIGLGIALILAAPTSKTPEIFQVLGGITIFAGLFLPVLGERRFETLLMWFSKLSPTVLRIWLLAGVAFGAYIIWAVLP